MCIRDSSWKARLGDWLLRPEMRALAEFLRQRKAAGARVYPPGPQTVSYTHLDVYKRQLVGH